MTAVEWFFRWVNDNPEATHKEYSEAFEQAKEMEKEQRINAQMDMFHHLNELPFGMQYLDKRDSAEQFCETYGSKGSDDKFTLEEQVEIPNNVKEYLNTSSQTEISDEEIEKEIVDLLYEFEYEEIPNSALYKFDYEGCAKALTKWYREQLKKKI